MQPRSPAAPRVVHARSSGETRLLAHARSTISQTRTRFEPAEVEPRITREWLESGLWHPEPDGDAAENYSIAIPPPNITGALHMGHALNGAIQDALDPPPPHGGPADEVDLRHRPREHRDPAPGRAGAARPRHEPRGARPRGVPRARLELARALRLDHRRAVQAPRRLLRLRRRALHDGRRLRRGGARRVRRALRPRLHPPRPLHGQLGPGLGLGDLRPRGRGARGDRHAVLDRLPARGRLGRAGHRDRAPGDDARRQRRRRQPGGRALRAPRRRARSSCRSSGGACR